MASLPRISIITPSFNQAAFLEETLNSFLSQEYPELEIIVVDGGSTDDSVNIIRKFEKHIKWWCSEQDHGQTDAIIKGLQHCTGEVITWINSDDLLEPGALKKVADYFSDPVIQAVCGRTRLFGEGRNTMIEPSVRRGETVLDALCRFNFNQQGTFYRKSAIEKMGMPKAELHFVMDKEWWNRFLLLHRIEEIYITNELLAGFRIHKLSKTGSGTSGFVSEYAGILTGMCRKHQLTDDLVLLEKLFPDSVHKLTEPGLLIPTKEVSHRMVACFLVKQLSMVYSEADFKKAVLLKEFLTAHPAAFDGEHRKYYDRVNSLTTWLRFRIGRKLKHWTGRPGQ